MTHRQIAALFLSVLVGLASASCVPPLVGGGAIVRPIRQPLLVTPSLPYTGVSFKTRDELKLRGWLFRPQTAPRGLVIFLHGKDDNRRYSRRIAERLVPLGYAVLGYDQRAHGHSDGVSITYGVREKYDLQRAMDAVPLTPVIVIGHSLGAAVALQAAAIDSRIRGVVALASYSDVKTIVRERMWFSPDDVVEASAREAQRAASFDFKYASPVNAASRIQVPVLLIHGTKDTFTKPNHSERIYAALGGAQKELVLIEGATHGGVLRDARSWEKVATWLDRVVAAPRSINREMRSGTRELRKKETSP